MIRILIVALLCIWLGLTLDVHAAGTEPCVGESHLIVLLAIAALAGAVVGILPLIIRERLHGERSLDPLDRDYPEGPY